MATNPPVDAPIGISTVLSRKPIRVLSLDGGGLRGLSSLIILRSLMEKVAIAKGISDVVSIRPSEYFDLIIGSGSGGVSALFLGRLRMTVNEAIVAYTKVPKAAFQPSDWFSSALQRSSPSRQFQQYIGNIVERYLHDRDAPLRDQTDDSPTCRTAVLACTQSSVNSPPHFFRSYVTVGTQKEASPFTVHDVARAAVAFPGARHSVSLGVPPVSYINASNFGHNNPADAGLWEAVLELHTRVDCLVSLGSGTQNIVQVRGGWNKLRKAFKEVAQSSEQVEGKVNQYSLSMNMPYFRFDVTKGLTDAEIQEQTQSDSAGFITDITESYIRRQEDRLAVCAKKLIADSTLMDPYNTGQGIGKFLPMQNLAPYIFHGRKKYVDQAVASVVKQPAARLAILGPGGIGKTSIALTILHDMAIKNKFDEHLRFVSCEVTTSSSSLVDTLCAAFDLHNVSGDRQNASGAREKTLLDYLTHTYTSKPLLLILDNFETVWDSPAKSEAESLLVMLGNVSQLSLIVTMRGTIRPARLQWTKPFLPVVERLDPQAAHQVFLDIHGEENDEKLDELLLALDYVPLAVTLMAQLGSPFTPGQLLEKWNKDKTRLLSLPSDQGRLKNVDVSISISLQSPQIQSAPVALRLLSIMALLPGGVHSNDLTAMIPSLKEHNLAVFTIVHVGLAYMDTTHVLHMLSPVRAYIMEYHKPILTLLNEVKAYFFNLANLGKKEPNDEGYQAMVVTLKKAESNIEAILTLALNAGDNPEECLEAALNWSRFLYFQTPRSDIIKLALELAKNKDMESHVARCLQSLGDTQYMLDHLDEAKKSFSEAHSKFEVLSDHQRVARCLYGLGIVDISLSNFAEAQSILFKAKAAFLAIGDSHGAAQCLQSLSDIHHRFGEFDEAQQLLSEAKDALEIAGDRLGVAHSLQKLGDLQRMLDNYDLAQQQLSEAHTIYEKIRYPAGVAQCLCKLGSIQHMLRHSDKGQQMISQAQTIFEAIGNSHGVAICMQNLGNIQRGLRQFDKARQLLSDAQNRYERIGEIYGATQCLQNLGNIQSECGYYAEAQLMLSNAKMRFERFGDKRGAGQCLRSLGNIEHLLHHYEEAQKMLSDAYSMLVQARERLGSAQCLMLLGFTSQSQNRIEEAVKYFTEARELFANIGAQTQEQQEKCSVALTELSNLRN